MTVLAFGELMSDLGPLGNPGLLVAENVLPSATGYLPRALHVAVTGALAGRPLSAIQARDPTGNVFQYAGDATKLYQLVDGVWTDRSAVGGYVTPGEQSWEFALWRSKVLATNFGNYPQQITVGETSFSDLTTDFRARHLAVIRDFVVGAHTTDPVDGDVPSRVRWSAYNNETLWTVDPSTLSDYQDLKTGEVLKIIGGEFGLVLQRNAVWRMVFVGAPTVFQFDEVLNGIGIITPNAIVRDRDSVFFLSDAGFYQIINGTQVIPIGAQKVDSTVLAELDADYLHRMSTARDPESPRIWWLYPGPGNVNGTPNRAAVYDRAVNRWTLQDIPGGLELLWEGGTTGLNLEQLDTISTSVDALPASLDASRWIGGQPVLAAFDASYQSGFFTGANATARIETGERELVDGRRARLLAWRPLVDGGAVRGRLTTRNRQTDAAVVGAYRTQSNSGRFTDRKNARYYRFGLELTGAWTHTLGLQVDASELRAGGRRG